MKKVTQIISYYNEEHFIGECIQSLLEQTYENLEIIVINDGSTDNSEKIVDSFQDPRIIKVSNQKNHGQAWGRNQGLDLATGDYVGFFDADDISDRYRIERLVKYLDSHEDIMVVSGSYICIDEDGKQISGLCAGNVLEDMDIRVRFLFENPVPYPCALIRRDILEKYQIRHIESIRVSQDYQFWLQCVQVGKFTKLKDVIFYYRLHDSQTKQIRRKNESEYEYNMVKIFQYAWVSRGLEISTQEAEFIFRYLYNGFTLRRLKDLKIGIKLYIKIRKEFCHLSDQEKKLIMAVYRKKLVCCLIIVKHCRIIIDILRSSWRKK